MLNFSSSDIVLEFSLTMSLEAEKEEKYPSQPPLLFYTSVVFLHVLISLFYKVDLYSHTAVVFRRLLAAEPSIKTLH